jgi:flagellum-specific peptidoglycan hydrolase FlgJ
MLAKEFLFFKQTVLAAIGSMTATGVPASITLAQAILESSWGQSGLAVKANNYFGIKAVQGEDYMEFPTHEFVHGIEESVLADFARYATVADSFTAHGRLLSTLPRYAPAMALRHSPEGFATMLQSCGYSTSSTYAASLMQLVREFNLTQYDIEPPHPTASAEGVAA